MKLRTKKTKKKKISDHYILGSGNSIIDGALEEDRGLLVYQETVMRLFADVIGLGNLGASDNIRRAISKKDMRAFLEEKERFIKGGQDNGIPLDILERYWDQVLANVGYSFNKSHAVAYSIITYQTLYYLWKCPGHFLAAWMNSHPEENEKGLTLAVLWGINIKLPHVNNSRHQYSSVKDEIYLPFSVIHGVGKRIQDAIEQHKPYSSLADFYLKLGGVVPRKIRALLYILGSFEGLPGVFSDLQTGYEISRVDKAVYLREYYKKNKNPDGSRKIKEDFRIGKKLEIFDNFFGGVILPNPRLAAKMRELYNDGYKFGRIKKLNKGLTSGYGGKQPRERLEIYFTDNWADLYIGSWQYPELRKLPEELSVGDLIAYKTNSSYGGKYVLTTDSGLEIKVLTGEI